MTSPLYIIIIDMEAFIFQLEVIYFLLVICFRVNVSVHNLAKYFLCMLSQNVTKISILPKNVILYKC